MRKSTKSKSLSSTTTSTDLDLFSSYSHEQVHIYDKLCSSLSSLCQIAYCTTEGVHICVPPTYNRQTSTSNLSPSSSSMLITRIKYPFESTDQTNSISSNSTAYIFFEKIKNTLLPKLYQSYKLRPSSLSSFDRLLSSDLTQYKGFRQCLFSPFDVTVNRGQSILATISCAHEVFVYEIVSSSKRFFNSESANLKFDLTKILFESQEFEKIFHDSENENDHRLLYSHLTTRILWSQTGKYLFQLQYSGHLIVWIFDGLKLENEKSLKIIDTKISKPLTMIWNENQQHLIVIGKENQRILIEIERMMTINEIKQIDENDFMNVDHCEFIEINQQTSILIESKINYCLISQITFDKNQPTIRQIDYRMLSSPIVGLEKSSSNPHSILIGCEDGSIHSLQLSSQLPIAIVELKPIASGQIKSCSRKPLLLRHFNLSFNEFLLARIFYSPIVSPNVKFGFVLCTFHRWTSKSSLTFERIVEEFLSRTNTPIWKSSDELAVILHEISRDSETQFQAKKITNENFAQLQRLCRLNSLFSPNKQITNIDNQLLQIYRRQLSSILSKYFSKMMNKLTPVELSIYTICVKDESYSSSSLLLCPLCNSLLNFTSTDLLYATCQNKHSWPRCSRSLLPLMMETSETCALCDRTINSLGNLPHFLRYKDSDLRFFFSSLCSFCM